MGVLAIIGFFLLYIEVRDAMKKSKPVPMRIDPKRKLKLLNTGRLDARRSHRRAARSKQAEAA